MEKTSLWKKIPAEKVSLVALLASGMVFLLLFLFSVFDIDQPHARHSSTSDLINTNEIATLSVSEFVYNGIARIYRENGEHDYNIFYNSTVKVSVDAQSIDYVVDEGSKTVLFLFSDFAVDRPVIDVSSLSIIPDRNDLFIDDVISLCRKDALEEAKKSGKLISSAQENLKSIMEAWYSPVFEGYTFEYQFGTTKGGEAK